MATLISEPRLVTEPWTLVDELSRGRWFLTPHEWLGDRREQWQSRLIELGHLVGVDVQFFDVPHRDMALGANGEALPSLEQVAESVAVMQERLWLARHGD